MKKITTAPFQYLVESCTAAAKSSSHFFSQLMKRPAAHEPGEHDKILRGKILDHRHGHKNDMIF